MSVKNDYQAWFNEYPNLLFTKVLGVNVFNATKFLESCNLDGDINVEDFKIEEARTIDAYSQFLDFSVDQLFLKDDNGDDLILADLCFLFIGYVNPKENIKIHDMYFRLLTKGFAMSDMYLALTAKDQLSNNILKVLANE